MASSSPKALPVKDLLASANAAVASRDHDFLFACASELCRRSADSPTLQKQTMYYAFFLRDNGAPDSYLRVYVLAQTIRGLTHNSFGSEAAKWALNKHLTFSNCSAQKAQSDQNTAALFEMNDRFIRTSRFVVDNAPFAKDSLPKISSSFMAGPVIDLWKSSLMQIKTTAPDTANDLAYWAAIATAGKKGSPFAPLTPLRAIKKVFCYNPLSLAAQNWLTEQSCAKKTQQSPTPQHPPQPALQESSVLQNG